MLVNSLTQITLRNTICNPAFIKARNANIAIPNIPTNAN
jgi:hypothetical protein